jgi:hypothetical protein
MIDPNSVIQQAQNPVYGNMPISNQYYGADYGDIEMYKQDYATPLYPLPNLSL